MYEKLTFPFLYLVLCATSIFPMYSHSRFLRSLAVHYAQSLCQRYGVSEKGHGSSRVNTGRDVDEGEGSLLFE